MRKILVLGVWLGLLSSWMGSANAQAYFKCVDANGHVRFSDRRCGNGRTTPVKPSKDVDSAERKVISDARIQRDKALGNQAQSNRLAQEKASYAAQDRQVQASSGIAASVAQARTQQQSSTQSVLPATTSIATQPPTN